VKLFFTPFFFFRHRKIFFLKRTKRTVLFFWRKRKELKENITHPRPSLKGGMQPLLLVALSLRYAQTIKGLAWIVLMGRAQKATRHA
jgi:hypothetical protein